MIHADIATKIIDPNVSIWVVFPGRGRRFINDFIRGERIFLETPGLSLPPGKAKDAATIRRHVRMSRAIADFATSTDTNAKVPSRNPSRYSDAPFKDRSVAVLASSVRKMFGRMKPGDLVIVPGKSYQLVYFAEVISDFVVADVTTVARYGSEQIPYRRIRWLNIGVPRYAVPPGLQSYLSKPPAIAHLLRTPETEEFFRLAYPAYVLADRSAVIMDGPKYDGKDPLATVEANYLVSYFISAFAAIEKDQLSEFVDLDVRTAIQTFYDRSLVQSFTQNFNSPGKYGLVALSAILSAFVSVAISVSLKGFSAAELSQGIEVTNSISPADAHLHDTGVKLDYLFKSLHQKEIDEINTLAKRSKEQIGLDTPVQLEIKP
ncbi:hypothetical protein [Bradyrhizobium sp. USDA 10063]